MRLSKKACYEVLCCEGEGSEDVKPPVKVAVSDCAYVVRERGVRM